MGLARIPTGVGSVEFTADRKRITDALMRVTGAASHRRHVARLISEAWALDSNDAGGFQPRSIANARVRRFGPRGLPQPGRGRRALDAARSQARARATLQSLEILLRNLAQVKTPVNIVMISEGMFVARDRQSMAEFGRRAAEARATIHIIRPRTIVLRHRRSRAGAAEFAVLRRCADERGARAGRGANPRIDEHVTGDGKIAFDRLGRELSGYYLIGFEPTDADRTGKERRIKVEVKAARPHGAGAADVRDSQRRHRDRRHLGADADAALGEVLEVAVAHARPPMQSPPTPPSTAATRCGS